MELNIQGYKVLIDDSDYPLLCGYNWTILRGRYVVRSKTVNGKSNALYMHRLIMGLTLLDKGKIVDHINHNPLDNRRCNLRVTDYVGNARNSSASGKSKYLGVSVYTNKKGYKCISSRIYVDKKSVGLGFHKTEEAAALAYNVAATKYFGEFANLNNV